MGIGETFGEAYARAMMGAGLTSAANMERRSSVSTTPTKVRR